MADWDTPIVSAKTNNRITETPPPVKTAHNVARANFRPINADPNMIKMANHFHLREMGWGWGWGGETVNSGAPNSNRSFPGSSNQLFWTQEHAKSLTSVPPQVEAQDWTWLLPRSPS